MNTTNKKMINLDEIINTRKHIRHITGFTNVIIYTKSGHTEQVYKKLKEASSKKPFKVFLKKDIPDYFHIKNNDRMGDILLLPNPGWTVSNKLWSTPSIEGTFERGEHGYSNQRREMSSWFVARGPGLKSGVHTKCIETVDVYVLMCYLLNITPLKHDGHVKRVSSFLKDFPVTDDETLGENSRDAC